MLSNLSSQLQKEGEIWDSNSGQPVSEGGGTDGGVNSISDDSDSEGSGGDNGGAGGGSDSDSSSGDRGNSGGDNGGNSEGG